MAPRVASIQRGGPANANSSFAPSTAANSGPDNGAPPVKKRRRRNRKGKNASKKAGAGGQAGLVTVQHQAGAPKVVQKPSQPHNRRLSAPARAFPRFNELPSELQKTIFMIAAGEHNWRNHHVTKWVYVSRKVREWIEPLNYNSIELPCNSDDCPVYESDRKMLELLERMLQSKPKEFITKNVRQIFTNSRPDLGDNSVELKLLSACDNLETLECWSSPRQALVDILTTKTWPRLKTLCLNIDILPKDENTFHFPLFQHVTHLDLKFSEPELLSWKSLKSLQNLTHMRVNMMEDLMWNEYEIAADKACAIACEMQKCFPSNLKYFVILIPIGVLYHISIACKTHKDEERWTKVEAIRLGQFDSRIMLGCMGDRGRWADHDILDYELDPIILRNSPRITYTPQQISHTRRDQGVILFIRARYGKKLRKDYAGGTTAN
ncbi:hypothetical protein D9756_011434 [Leucocoprinus leucothites]|uniref:Uncharacterized protein n=1 Tax=Leucocoprinus leucothites TaxID=201217 RepID=A0A8H5CLK5_9AGAR|nr:hypothetical protein D9756_011434 [Leucoagaricus leucothites]